MELRLADELGMEGRREDPPLSGGDRVAVDPREDLDRVAVLDDPRGSDEHRADRRGESVQLEVGLEAPDLPAERVALSA